MLRQRKTAKVQGIVQRARDRLLGGPVGTSDDGFDDDEDRVQRVGDLLANIVMYMSSGTPRPYRTGLDVVSGRAALEVLERRRPLRQSTRRLHREVGRRARPTPTGSPTPMQTQADTPSRPSTRYLGITVYSTCITELDHPDTVR